MSTRYCGGIRTLDDIRDRCRIDDETGCWRWAGALNNSGSPILWFAPLRGSVSIGTVIGYLKTGARPGVGRPWFAVCGNRDCANPEHRRTGGRVAQMRHAELKRSPATLAKMKNARRARSRLTTEIVDEIRASDQPCRVMAERYGISIATVSRIRRHEIWAQAVRGASVFNLGRPA